MPGGEGEREAVLRLQVHHKPLQRRREAARAVILCGHRRRLRAGASVSSVRLVHSLCDKLL